MKITPNDEPLRFDGDNSYPDCTCCGQCCGLNVLAITPEELDAMHECIERKHVHPIDRKGERCPLQSPEGGCINLGGAPAGMSPVQLPCSAH